MGFNSGFKGLKGLIFPTDPCSTNKSLKIHKYYNAQSLCGRLL